MEIQNEIKAFEGWCIVELMGHNAIAGYCSEQVVAGTAMLRIDVPEVADRPAFTKMVSGGAIYGITPTTEELARRAAEQLQVRPVTIYILPEAPRPRFPVIDPPDASGDYLDDGPDDEDDEENVGF